MCDFELPLTLVIMNHLLFFLFEDTVSLNIYYNFSFKYSLFMHLIHLILTVKQINGPLVESLGTLI